MEFLAGKLRQLRDERGYSLGELSRLLDRRCGLRASRTSLNQWENGRALPTIRSLMAVCELYRVEPGIFFSGLEN